MKESVKDKLSGFLVKNISQMIKKVSEIEKIDREKTRKWAIDNFSNEIITDKYIKSYKKLNDKKTD